MTSTYLRQKNQQDRWVLLIATGFAALCFSVIVLGAKRALVSQFSVLEESELSGSLTLEFQPSPNSDYSFKIMQIADIHLGENSWTDWGPEQDIKTFHVLDSVILAEQPDLIVLSGDQLTANNVDENATAYYRTLGEKLSYYGIPWALIFGNHDDAPLERGGPNNTIYKFPAKTSRQQLLAVDQEFQLSLTQSTSGIFGSSNYVLNLHYPSAWFKDAKKQVAVQLFFLDSGGGSLVAQLEQSQIDWFHQQHRPDLPGAVVFQHIPATQFVYDGRTCHGLHVDAVDPIVNDPDPGIVQTLQNAKNVRFLAVGHNHGNDYCCSTKNSTPGNTTNNLHLCFGRHSGYGGYGSWDRGVRMYHFHLKGTNPETVSFEWRSWVRMENQTIIDPYDPQRA